MFKKLRDALFSRETASGAPSRNHAALATCVILLEAAHADDDFTDEERGRIVAIMEERFALSAGESRELLEEALAVREESTDMWQFTNAINRAYSVDEKIAIMEEVWRIIYSDGVLHAYEDHLAGKLQTLLNLNHPQKIAAKMKALEELRGA